MASYLLVPRRWWDTRPPVAQFPFRFVVLLIPVLVLVPRLVEYGPAAVDLTTRAVAWVSSALGLAAMAEPGGRMTFADGAFWYEVIPACTTAVPTVLFAALVLAYPATWRQRAVGVLLGVPALFLFNLLRLVLLAWIGVHAMATYDAVHWVGFQALFVFVVGLLWVTWIRVVVQRGERPRGLASLSGDGWWRAPAMFLSSFAVLGLVVSLDPIQRAYTALFAIPFAFAKHVLWWSYDVQFWIGRGDLFVYPLTTAAFVSLYLATRRFPLRERLRAVNYPLIPVLFATQLVDLLANRTIDIASGDGHTTRWGPNSSLIASGLWEVSHVVLLSVVPFLCWLVWTRQQANELQANPTPNEVLS